MKKTNTFLVCLLIAAIGWIGLQSAKAQQTPAQTSARLAAPLPGLVRPGLTRPDPTQKHLYLRGGKTHLMVQRTHAGTRVYRQVGQRMIPMN